MLGVLITPERLIELGPFRRSLTFDNPLVVKTALIEVAFIRVSCFVFGTLLLGSAVFWRRVLASGPVRAIMSHRVEQTGYFEGPRSPWNLSLSVTTMAWLLGISYIAFGGIVLPEILTAAIDKYEGPIEDLTALIFLICSVVFGFVAIRYRARRIERFYQMTEELAFLETRRRGRGLPRPHPVPQQFAKEALDVMEHLAALESFAQASTRRIFCLARARR